MTHVLRAPKGGDDGLSSSRIAILRQKIDNEDYLLEAIQRIAQILSNELLDIPQGGALYERKGRQ
jgi:hypothetical protein